MRLISFLLCFCLALVIFYFVNPEPKIISTPLPKVLTSSPPPIEKINKIPPIKRDLEYSGDTTISYNGYKIRNLEKGLSISKKGKRLLFVPVAGIPFGKFGLKSLLGGNKKQLIYETYTGGNHCCAEQSIIDLSSSTPQVIFRSLDYDVQKGEFDDFDALGTFDKENDGILEITQKFTYGLSRDCAYVSNPVIYVGFKYDKKARKYLPMKDFAPRIKEWVTELKATIEKRNISVRNNQRPEEMNSSCDYHSSVIAVALNYIYTGKEKEGFDYLEKNYLEYDNEKDSIRFNAKTSKKIAKEIKADIRKHLASDKLYRAVYSR